MVDVDQTDSSENSDVLADLMSGAFSSSPRRPTSDVVDTFEESFAMPFDAPLVGGSDDSGFGEGDEDDENGEYTSREGIRFATPIFFEDGMDFIECQLYYKLKASQHKGGVLPRLRFEKPRSNSAPVVPLLRSCLRTPSRSLSNKSSPKSVVRKPMRRCSFTGTPRLEDEDVLDSSCTSLDDCQVQLPEQRHIGFFEFAQVLTIPTRSDLFRLRSELWMSRQEMEASLRKAAVSSGSGDNSTEDFPYWQASSGGSEDASCDDDEEDDESDSMLAYVKAQLSSSYESKTTLSSSTPSKNAVERQCSYESVISEYHNAVRGRHPIAQ